MSPVRGNTQKEKVQLCEDSCACQCQQGTCGCHSRKGVFIPNRPIIREKGRTQS